MANWFSRFFRDRKNKKIFKANKKLVSEQIRRKTGMMTSKKGVDLIKHFEGVRLKAYKDAVGIPTIGYGSTKGVTMGMKITAQEAEGLLRRDLQRFEDAVNEYVLVPLNQSQFDALVSFSYNVGTGALRKSTLLKKLNKRDYAGASLEFLRWTRAGKRRLKGLVRRREAERQLFIS